MSLILTKAVIRGGQVEVDKPIDLPDGSEVAVSLLSTANSAESDDEMSPEEIARILTATFSRSEGQAYGFRAGAIYVHDTASGQVIQKIGKDLQIAAFSSSTNRALSAGEAPIITLWDLQRATEIQTFAGHTDKIEWLSFSWDGSKAMSASRDGTIR